MHSRSKAWLRSHSFPSAVLHRGQSHLSPGILPSIDLFGNSSGNRTMARTCTRNPMAKAAKAENARASKPKRRNVKDLDMVKKTQKGRAVTITWSKKEDSRLKRVVYASGQCDHYCWSSIAANMPGRNGKQCRERWMHQLRPGIKKGAWTDDEDRLVLTLQEQLGNKWKEISEQLPGRSDNCVKNRWYSFRNSVDDQCNKTTAGLFDAAKSSPRDGDGTSMRPVESRSGGNSWKAPTVSDGAQAGRHKSIAELSTGDKTKRSHGRCPRSKLIKKRYEAKPRDGNVKVGGLTQKDASIYKTPTKKIPSLLANPISASGVPVNIYDFQDAASTLSAMSGCFSNGVEVMGSQCKEDDPPAMPPFRSPIPYSVRANDIFSPSYFPQTPTPAPALTSTSSCHSGPFFRNLPMFRESTIALNGVAIGDKSTPSDYFDRVDVDVCPGSIFSLDSPSSH
ncbi:hypothetical protein ACHAWF_002983, partial [Thalassiosira exigua]